MSGTRRVVVGVSGSPASILALRIGGALARRDDIPLVAVHAWVPPGGDVAERRAPSPELRVVWKRAALERLQDAIESAWGGLAGDLLVEHVVRRGQAAPVLLDIASSPDDLLVVGAGTRGALSRLWHGRVTRHCQARARCPMLTVPPPALEVTRPNRLREWSFRRRELTAEVFLRDVESLGPPSR